MQVNFVVKRGKEDSQLRAGRAFGGQSEVANILGRRNDALARDLRNLAADRVEASIGTESGQWAAARRGQSTRRLVRATANSLNSYASPLTLGVGREEYLDKTVPYWRQFEFGSSVHVGDPIRFTGPTRSYIKSNGKRGRIHVGTRPIRFDHVGVKPNAHIVNPIKAHNVYTNLIERGQAMSFLRSQAREYYKHAIGLSAR